MAATLRANFSSISNAIHMTNATLIVTNPVLGGIRDFSAIDSVIEVPCGYSSGLILTNLMTGGASNLIRIAALPYVSFVPNRLTVISYAGSIAGAGYNFSLGSLPAGSSAYTAHLVNNAAARSVDLVLTSFHPSQPLLTSQTVSNGFQLNLSGDPGCAVELFASTNLIDWVLLTTVTNTTGHVAIVDPSTNGAQRFYRAEQLPTLVLGGP